MTRRLLVITGVLVLVAGAFAAGYGVALRRATSDPSSFVLLREVQRLIETRFVSRDVADDQLRYGAARGMLAAVDDPYTRFMDPRAFKEFQDSAFSGQFTGIGIIMDLKDGHVIVVSPIPGTPAVRAGLLAGDRIVQIDGHPTRDMALQRAVSLIRGSSGTVVHLTVARG